MAAVGEKERKGVRKSEFKVKSGCVTCKARRVKCDERKPACTKCTSTGRPCEGYADLFRIRTIFMPLTGTSFPSTSSRGLTASPGTDQQISAHSALGLPLDAHDRHYFNYFRQRCIHDFVGLVDTDFWNHYILRISTCKPAAQHAILALSAQHETFVTRGRGGRKMCDHQGATYSLRQYTKAVKSLYSVVDHGLKNAAATEETLVICLLFIVFEVLQGNYPAALTHLEGGLQILSNCNPLAKSIFGHVNEGLSASSLAKAFGRLDIQASSYLGERSPKPFPAPVSIISSQSPIRELFDRSELVFANVGEARDTLNTHIASVYHFMRSPAQSLQIHPSFNLKRVMHLKYEPSLHLPTNNSIFIGLFREQKIYLDALRRWALAFETFLKQSNCRSSPTNATMVDVQRSEEARQYAVLWISYLVIFINLSTCLEPDECSYDAFLLQFTAIVEHAEFILYPKFPDNKTPIERNRFSFEMNVIQPLYFTALKCRDFALRSHAISLLRISGQEGVWDGKMLSTVAKFIIEHEESEGCVDLLYSEIQDENLLVLEPARVHGVALDGLDPISGKLCIEYSKRSFIDIHDIGKGYEWIMRKELLEP